MCRSARSLTRGVPEELTSLETVTSQPGAPTPSPYFGKAATSCGTAAYYWGLTPTRQLFYSKPLPGLTRMLRPPAGFACALMQKKYPTTKKHRQERHPILLQRKLYFLTSMATWLAANREVTQPARYQTIDLLIFVSTAQYRRKPGKCWSALVLNL